MKQVLAFRHHVEDTREMIMVPIVLLMSLTFGWVSIGSSSFQDPVCAHHIWRQVHALSRGVVTLRVIISCNCPTSVSRRAFPTFSEALVHVPSRSGRRSVCMRGR